jgi:hypothetical protein
MAHQTSAIVVATALHSYSEQIEDGRIETITNMSIEEVIKGDPGSDRIDVREPGGVVDGRAMIVPGVPRFEEGERYVLFLTDADGVWRVRDLALGKFSFRTDQSGRKLLVRDEGEIVGWDGDHKPHQEGHRSEAGFLDFLRVEGKGGMGTMNYLVPKEPLMAEAKVTLQPAPNATTFSATSYTFTLSGSLGGRWNVFPTAVTFFSVGTEPGAPGGGSTAITTAFGSWNGDPNSNVNYVYAGQDTSGTHTGGVSRPDSQNSITFEVDLFSFGAGPFQCSANSYSGTLGLGGITSTNGTHAGPNNETFVTAKEGDVAMNKGIANCSLLINSGDFDSAVTHEVGHTLGFRHSDQTRADDPATPCSTDPTLECSNNAIMKSFVSSGLHAALQPWDQHAVAAVYPGTGTGGTAPGVPSGVNARATSTTAVLVTWNAVTGATSYKILRKSPGTAFVQISTTTSTSFTDTTVAANTAYLYEIQAVNGGGTSAPSAPDLATTVIFTDDPLTPRVTVIKAIHLSQLRVAVNAVRALAGLGAGTYTDAATPGVIVKAIHITQLRNALDQALSALGLASGGYTDSVVPGIVIKAVHFQELRNRVK